MAPGRRRGANRAAAKSQLKLGDLVLAKVKGFPPWPAKISKPEDWKRHPDSKKYFVKFFGTNEIAFIAPADVQAFTDEVKSKLLSRGPSKANYFAEAVKEICAAFDELNKHNSSCLQDDTDGSDFGSSVPIVDGVEDNEDLKDGIVTVESNQAIDDDFGDGGPNFLQSEGEVNDGYDVKPKIEFHQNHGSSPVLSSEKGKKKSAATDKKSEHSGPNSSQLKEKISVPNNDDLRIKTSGNRQMALKKSGQKSEMIGSGAKRKSGDAVELNESNTSSVAASEDDSSVGSPDNPESGSRLKDGIKGKVISEAIDRGDFVSDLKSDSKNGGGEKSKDLLKGRKISKVKNEPRRDIKEEHYVRKRRLQPGEGKPALETNDIMHGAKKMKSEELGDGQTSQHKSKKMVSGGSNVADNQEAKTPEFKKYSSRTKSESTFNVSTTGTGTSIVSDDKKLLSQSAVGQLQQTSIAIVDGKKNNKSLTEKKHAPHNSTVRVPANQQRKKRRAVCLFDDDEDEEPKTPVHGAFAINVIVPDDTKKTAAQDVSSNHTEQNVKEASSSQDSHSKESLHLPIKPQTPQLKKKDNAVDKLPQTPQLKRKDNAVDKLPQTLQLKKKDNAVDKLPQTPQLKKKDNAVDKLPQTPQLKKKDNAVDKLMAGSVSRSVEKLESEQLTLKTPKKSPEFEIDTKQVVEEANVPKFPVNTPRPASQKQAHALSSKRTGERSLKSPQVQAKNQLHRPASSAERPKSIPKSSNRVNEYDEPAETSLENNHFSGRMEAVREDKSRSVIVSKTSDSGTSMKHLIAAAQAKRRQTHSQSTPLGIFDSAFFSLTDLQEQSPSPSLVQPFLPSTSNVEHTNLQGSYQLSDLPSLPINDRPLTSPHQSYIEESEVGRASPINRAAGDALGGDTDASVARDAFEGMIETLSRTKESIGRATRLAIDCAKYGIANEVVELLIHKLETETIVQRKVDLFFLVDSITQCSHSQRGIAGASYIPTVQTALSRLLGAAAPPGAHARENRRQCHKVLRLWLERKILPESVLRRHIEELGVSNDDSTVSFSLRRPARAERSVDDPIREMEGMLVDEYGSNASFQLPGFLSSRVFEDDDEDFEQKLSKEKGKASPMSPTHCANDLEACAVAPSDRRHFILEDVDGELEMEDVSGQLKDAKPLVRNISLEMSSLQQGLEKSMEHLESPPLPENSPPLPVDSPPPLPPLPPSPPPPLPPPPLSPSSSPLPPPPPPPSLLLQPPRPLPTPGPPPLLISQQLEPTQPAFPPPQILPPQSSLQSQQLAYQVPVPLEYCNTSSVQGNQLVQMGNLSHGGQVDASVKSERFQQQSPCFVPTGTCTSREPSGFNSSRQLEYGHSDMYLNTQLSCPNQPFQQVNTPFVQGPPQPAPPLNPSSHFSFQGTAAPHQPPHPYGPYSMPSHPDSRRQFSGDGQWRMPSGEFKAENHSLWMNGGRTPSYTGPPFGQEGYFRPPYGRPPSNSVSFQQTVPNNLTPGAPISAHSVPQILPSRPDISTVNCWRQA